MPAFWEGVLSGYGIAIPVGAIAILIVETGLRRGFRYAFAAGAGTAAADVLYAAAAAVAGEIAAAALAPYSGFLTIASAAVLCGLGALGLRRLWSEQRARDRQRAHGDQLEQHEQREPRVNATSRPIAPTRALPLGTFAQFLGLTLLNPLTVVYFGALIFAGGATAANTTAARIAFVMGAGLASLSWQTLLAGLGSLGRRRLSSRAGLILSVVGNLVIIALGVRIALALV